MRRRLQTLLFALAVVAGLAAPAMARGQEGGRHAAVIRVDDTVQPVVAKYVSRAMRDARADGASLIVIELDTPGGLLGATRDIVEEIMESDVPVVVYVTPSGAEATSAGVFIAAAAHVSAMAPGTSIGTATGSIEGNTEFGAGEPVTEEARVAYALLRAISEARGRPLAPLEQTVFRWESFTAMEALDHGIIDLVADDLPGLLIAMDGRTVTVSRAPVTLSTAGLAVRALEQKPLEKFIKFISSPNVAFLLIAFGVVGLLIELITPGVGVPGVVGALCLALAFIALGNLPVNFAGVALLLVSAGLFLIEVKTPGLGVFAAGGGIAFILGAFFLFGGLSTPPIETPSFRVNPLLIVSVTAVMVGALVWLAREIMAAKKLAESTSESVLSSFVGQTAYAITAIAPTGSVTLAGEAWSARDISSRGVGQGQPMKVVRVDGLTLEVEPEAGQGTGEEPGRESVKGDPAARTETEFDATAQRPSPTTIGKAPRREALPDGLTAREVEVLRKVSQGLTNSQVAAELHISINTVTRHLTNIYTKTGTSNRAEAATYAARHELV